MDLTPIKWLRRTWPADKCPYRYTVAGSWVRRAMPWSGRMRAQRLLDTLTDFVERMQGDLHDEFKVPRDTRAHEVATLILAIALMDKQSPFVVYNVQPNGRTYHFHRLRVTRSWHPDSPGRGVQR